MSPNAISRKTRLLCGAGLLLGAYSLANIAPLAFAQIQSIERHGDETQRGPSTGNGAAPPAPSVPQLDNQGAAPDTTGIWHFIRTGDAAAARRELQRLQAEFPRWQPPADMLANLARVETPAASRQAARAPAPSAASNYGPGVNQLIEDIRNHRAVGRETAVNLLARAVMQRRDAGTAEQLGWAYLDAHSPDVAQQWFERADLWGGAASARQGHVRALVAQGRWDDAKRLAQSDADLRTVIADAAADTARAKAEAGAWPEALAAAAIADRDGHPGTTASLGWIALGAGNLTAASQMFATAPDNEDAVYGTLLTLDQSHAVWGDIVNACTEKMRSDRHREACGNALAARALAAYQANDWTQTVAIDEAMRKLGVAQPGIGSLAAWSHYRRKEYAVAAMQFETLYRGGEDVADGLVLSNLALGHGAAIAAQAKTDPKIAAVYDTQERAQAMARKKFQLAATLGSGEDPTLTNIAVPEGQVGDSFRDKSGTSGEDKLAINSVNVGASYGWSGDRLSINVTDAYVRTGQPLPTASIGSLLPWHFAPTTNATLYTPVAAWEHDTVDERWSVMAGLSPVGGAVSSLPVGRVQWEESWSKVIATVTVKAAPVFESLLSMSGMVDPATGRPWGRVLDIGPQVDLTYLATDNIALSGSIDTGVLTGKDVVSNTRVGGSLSLNYQFKPAGFDYIRIGPSYAYQHYDKNEFFFTVGNGGYYSPDQMQTVGGFIDFQTDEGRRWLISGRVSGGWTHKVEASAPALPLINNGERVGGATGSEFTTDSTIRAQVMLGSYLRLGVMGRYTLAPDGRDRAAGITLSIPFGARSATFSSDLPHFLDRTWP